MNPCPCGQLGNATTACRCTPDAVLRYQGQISGPLLDRIDLQIEVPAVAAAQLAAAADGEASAVVAGRVAGRASARSSARAAPTASSPARRSTAIAASTPPRALPADARRPGSAGRRAAFIACCASRAPSPISTAHATITTSHLGEAIQYRRVLGAAG